MALHQVRGRKSSVPSERHGIAGKDHGCEPAAHLEEEGEEDRTRVWTTGCKAPARRCLACCHASAAGCAAGCSAGCTICGARKGRFHGVQRLFAEPSLGAPRLVVSRREEPVDGFPADCAAFYSGRSRSPFLLLILVELRNLVSATGTSFPYSQSLLESFTTLFWFTTSHRVLILTFVHSLMRERGRAQNRELGRGRVYLNREVRAQ